MKNKFMQYMGNIYSLENVLSAVRGVRTITISYRDTTTKALIDCKNEEDAKKLLDVIFEALGK